MTTPAIDSSDPCNGLAWNCDPFLPGPEWNCDCSAQESIDISVATLQTNGASMSTAGQTFESLTGEHCATAFVCIRAHATVILFYREVFLSLLHPDSSRL